ncbi:MAG: anti-sigma factor antagonist [Alicyclobacillus herbarius]|uniref:STAS domain-containing protein n=1 Tax=Alicyclobacillus herbarius TaxID=122960 RepID=UPI00042392BD|nr:anti-sigma factor antagonist [Alicyclobacillus herbarius]MCL6631257.1 anti-sigma factor antagonist [Alicyclobacillus herbarius]
MAMQLEVHNGVIVVRLDGELGHHEVESIRNQIESALNKTGYQGLVMSFRDIDFVDSSALGLILGRYKSVTERRGKMALCEVNAPLARLFELSGLKRILPIAGTVEEALQWVQEG